MTQRTKVSVCISLEFLVVPCALKCYRRVRRATQRVENGLETLAFLRGDTSLDFQTVPL